MIAQVPLKTLVDPSRPITYGIVQAGEDYPGGIRYIRPIDMNGHSGVDPNELRTTAPDIAQAYRRSSLLPGDIVVSIGPGFGKTMIVPDELSGANLTQGTARIATRKGVSNRYLTWALQSRTSTDFWESQIAGATFRALNLGPLSRTPIPCWAYQDQELIADFLAHKTAKIDTLIEKQRALVDGLRARREAVIRRAVTGGAIGDRQGWIPSRQSWTGRHPKGWRTEKIAWLFKLIGSGTAPPAEDISEMGEGLIPWVNTSELRESRIHNVVRGVPPEVVLGNSALKIYPAGAVLFAMYGATIGRMGMLDVPASVNQACLALANPRSDVYNKFVYYALQAARGYIIQLASGGGQPNVNQEKVKSVGIPISNYDEQREIVDYIDRETARIDAVIAKSERMIGLSQERRSALITAAVTGQINVAKVESPREEAV